MADLGLGSWPARRARIDADAIALRQGDRSLTYRALAARVEHLARALTARGVVQGDRVAYLGPNDIATFEVFFAACRLGAIFVPFNWRLAPPEIAYLVSDCTPRVLVHDPQFAGVSADLPTDRVELGAAYDALVEQGAALPVARTVDVGLADDAVILYTSGTTGRPKGAVLTHTNLTFNTMNQLAHADVLSSDTALCMCPLFHATGLGQVSLPTLFKGGTVVVVPRFEAGAVLAAIAELRVSSFSAVPTMLALMADHPDFAVTDLSSLRYANYGGSMVEERVALAWQSRGIAILQGYGMTEAAPGVYMVPQDGDVEQRPLSIGVPHFFTDVTVDPDRDEPAPGSSGELLVRGPNVFRGYWGRPEDTAKALSDGWYRTGDVVRVDEDGWAYVIDRIKDMIISGGENIYPSEVEAALLTLPGVTDCAVIGVPDARWGEVGAAYVVATPEHRDAEALRAALRERIAAFKVPAYVHFVEQLPHTATGKVQRQALRAEAAGLRPPAGTSRV